jgi:hypothetical protein
MDSTQDLDLPWLECHRVLVNGTKLFLRSFSVRLWRIRFFQTGVRALWTPAELPKQLTEQRTHFVCECRKDLRVPHGQ